jgi:hypothetical protein
MAVALEMRPADRDPSIHRHGGPVRTSREQDVASLISSRPFVCSVCMQVLEPAGRLCRYTERLGAGMGGGALSPVWWLRSEAMGKGGNTP